MLFGGHTPVSCLAKRATAQAAPGGFRRQGSIRRHPRRRFRALSAPKVQPWAAFATNIRVILRFTAVGDTPLRPPYLKTTNTRTAGEAILINTVRFGGHRSGGQTAFCHLFAVCPHTEEPLNNSYAKQ